MRTNVGRSRGGLPTLAALYIKLPANPFDRLHRRVAPENVGVIADLIAQQGLAGGEFGLAGLPADQLAAKACG
jgi:hypothetical protein